MPTTEDKTFQRACLEEHNKLRAKHGCPPLKFSQKLTDAANLWAHTIATKENVDHSSDSPYGENVYIGKGLHLTGDTPVTAWYSEMKEYNFKKAQFTPKCGHFTQVIWKSSQEMGIGVCRMKNTSFVVVFYQPRGNVPGNFQDNVPQTV